MYIIIMLLPGLKTFLAILNTTNVSLLLISYLLWTVFNGENGALCTAH